MASLNVASFRTCTEAAGPGKRFAIWCQGCRKRCPGCCNPEMQPFVRKSIMSVDELATLIARSKQENGIEGVSFLGGEPVLQASGFAELAVRCQKLGLSVMLYTGYLYEEVCAAADVHMQTLLSACDLLLDGPFLQECADTERDWVGSANQKLYFLTDRYAPGIEKARGKHSMEILVSADEIHINGWPFVNLSGMRDLKL